MSEERKKVLKMLEEGKIDVEEAEQLLSTLGDKGIESEELGSEKEDGGEANFLKINVVEDGEEKVNISIPVGLVKALKQIIPEKAKERLNEKGIEIDKIISQVEKRTFSGKLMDIDDGKSHVEIRIVD